MMDNVPSAVVVRQWDYGHKTESYGVVISDMTIKILIHVWRQKVFYIDHENHYYSFISSMVGNCGHLQQFFRDGWT